MKGENTSKKRQKLSFRPVGMVVYNGRIKLSSSVGVTVVVSSVSLPDDNFSSFSVISESLHFQLNFPAGFYQKIQQQFLSDLQLIELNTTYGGREGRELLLWLTSQIHISIWTGSYHEQIKYETFSQRKAHLTSVKNWFMYILREKNSLNYVSSLLAHIILNQIKHNSYIQMKRRLEKQFRLEIPARNWTLSSQLLQLCNFWLIVSL